MKNMRKKSAAVVAGLVMTGLVGASAASLGGANSASLGADVATVASCDTNGVALEYTASFDAASNFVKLFKVDMSGINPACDGLDYEITLTGTDSNGDVIVLGSPTTGSIYMDPAGSGADDLLIEPGEDFIVINTAAANIDAELVTGAAVTITG